ncbi:MAG: glycosyltransferase family 4 protein [Sphingomicrobium sp.]
MTDRWAGKAVANGPIMLAANSCWNIVNFRRPLLAALSAAGHQLVVVAPNDGYADRLAALGATFVPIRLASSGLSPLADARLVADYARLLRAHRPAALLGFTIKPNIYASLAARGTGIPVINNISGLGTAFLRPGPLQHLVTLLYRAALSGSATVFFQNPDDRALFLDRRLVRPAQVRLLSGSGIDLGQFTPRPGPAGDGVRFLLVARLLWDKGVGEYVEAARQLRQTYPTARFALLGPVGADNRSAVPQATVDGWVAEGVVDYLGEAADVRPAIAAADCVVLPSYREGMPRSLIEAAAMGRPAIASDVPGCRQAVEDGVTGFLCAVRSADSLAQAMARMIDLSPAEREKMGAAARELALRAFDEKLVVRAYLDALADHGVIAPAAAGT